MINYYFQIAAVLFGIHNYAALSRPQKQRLKWCWHLIQLASIALFTYSGLLQEITKSAIVGIAVNVLLGGLVYSIALHGLKYLRWRIPTWFHYDASATKM